MTTLVTQPRTALRRAAVRATLAPSVHNTQPWSLRLTKDDALQVHADLSRQLRVLDPNSRQLTISCGSALFNARVSLAGDGIGAQVHRTAGAGTGDLLATVVPNVEPVDAELAELDSSIERRQTNRRRFYEDEVPEALLATLEAAAHAEEAWLHVLRDPEQLVTVATLSRRAYDVQSLDPACRAELRAWTTDDPMRRDGVTAAAESLVDSNQCLVLLGTGADGPADWLRAGEALERVLLEITRNGFVASPITQVTEVPSARAQLRSQLGLPGYPHLLLRIGRAPVTPSSRRRRLVDVLTEDD
jgi:nitroreductase